MSICRKPFSFLCLDFFRELVGIMASLERFQVEAEEKGNPFVIGLLEKQHSRLKMTFDRHVVRKSASWILKTPLTCYAIDQSTERHRASKTWD